MISNDVPTQCHSDSGFIQIDNSISHANKNMSNVWPLTEIPDCCNASDLQRLCAVHWNSVQGFCGCTVHCFDCTIHCCDYTRTVSLLYSNGLLLQFVDLTDSTVYLRTVFFVAFFCLQCFNILYSKLQHYVLRNGRSYISICWSLCCSIVCSVFTYGIALFCEW